MNFHECDLSPDKPEQWRGVERLLREKGASAVIVCLPQDNESLYVAVEYRTLLDKLSCAAAPVFVRLGRNERLGRFLGEGDADRAERHRLIPFGGYADILSTDVLITDSLNQLARAAHATWPDEEGDAATDLDWEARTERYRMLCRRDADHLRVRLAQVGLTLVPTKEEPAVFEFTRDQVEQLTQLAHRRWRIEELMQGRKPKHPDWSGLSAAVRERNRRAIRSQPALLARMHWQIVPCDAEPCMPVAAPAPSGIATAQPATEITPQPEAARSLATGADPVA